VFGWQFILLTVVHAIGSEGLSSLDIATSSSLSTLTAAEEGERGKANQSETQDTGGGGESDDETFVLTASARVEATRCGGVGVGSGPDWDILLKLLGGLTGAVDATSFGTFLKSEGDGIGDL